MKITELMAELRTLHHEYGDLRVITSGFDENYLCDISTIDLIKVQIGGSSNGHWKVEENYEAKWSDAIEKCVYI